MPREPPRQGASLRSPYGLPSLRTLAARIHPFRLLIPCPMSEGDRIGCRINFFVGISASLVEIQTGCLCKTQFSPFDWSGFWINEIWGSTTPEKINIALWIPLVYILYESINGGHMCRLFINQGVKSITICLFLMGAGSFAQAQIPQTNFRELFVPFSPSQPTRTLKNNYDFPMVIDYVCVKSDSASPVLLQVMGLSLNGQTNNGLVGEYSFLPKSVSEENQFIVCQPISIVILPGDTIRGIAPFGGMYSISVNGHFVFPPFFFPNLGAASITPNPSTGN